VALVSVLITSLAMASALRVASSTLEHCAFSVSCDPAPEFELESHNFLRCVAIILEDFVSLYIENISIQLIKKELHITHSVA